MVKQKIRNLLVTLICGLLLFGCAYVQNTFKQAGYENSFKRTNKKAILKHLLTSDTFFVYGEIKDQDEAYKGYSMAVAAISKSGQKNEVVDVTHFARGNSFYGLHLPAGDYRLTALADLNADGFYTPSEVIALIPASFDETSYPDYVAGGIGITVSQARPSHEIRDLKIPVQSTGFEKKQSLFFPKGTIRTVDDPVFSRSTATLGMYDPAAFMAIAPMMFYALEEDLGHKVPVVFVHGIGGSITDFIPLLEKLDRQRYRPWFFYYPSGADLDKLAHLFFRIFLSGTVILLDAEMPMVVVAHSMGGLVVRKALNLYAGTPQENHVAMFVSIATPFGGHPDAKRSLAAAPVVLPSWYDLNPDGEFIRDLYEKPLPKRLEHHLLYAYGNSSTIKFGENNDGVVPLYSQLHAPAQAQSKRQYGYNKGHVAILIDGPVISQLLKLISTVEAPFPKAHLNFLFRGGFDVELSIDYSDLERYIIHNYGKYFRALSKGWIKPFREYQANFVAGIKGEEKAGGPLESAWLKFEKDYPALAMGGQE